MDGLLKLLDMAGHLMAKHIADMEHLNREQAERIAQLEAALKETRPS